MSPYTTADILGAMLAARLNIEGRLVGPAADLTDDEHLVWRAEADRIAGEAAGLGAALIARAAIGG